MCVCVCLSLSHLNHELQHPQSILASSSTREKHPKSPERSPTIGALAPRGQRALPHRNALQSSKQNLGQGLPGAHQHCLLPVQLFVLQVQTASSHDVVQAAEVAVQDPYALRVHVLEAARLHSMALPPGLAPGGHVHRPAHAHDSCAPGTGSWRLCRCPACPQFSLACPASRPSPGALGFKPTLGPNRRQALRRPWHARMQRPLEPFTTDANTMASIKTDTRCAVQRGKIPGMPGKTVLRAARSPRLRAHPPPCAELGVCAVQGLALPRLLYWDDLNRCG
jgi:hypothetical protein